MVCRVVNLEKGYPSLQIALSNLSQSILTAKATGTYAVKFIHGYGSSGKGGIIKEEVHKELNRRLQLGQIHNFIVGEDFSPFNSKTQQAVKLFPDLIKDIDYSKCNHGITLVII